MPKLREPIYQVKDTELLALIDKWMRMRGVKKQDLADTLNCCINTMSTLLKHPEKFTIKQLRIIFDYLKFSPEDRASILSNQRYL